MTVTDKSDGLWWQWLIRVVDFDYSGLIRVVDFNDSGLIREVVFDDSDW